MTIGWRVRLLHCIAKLLGVQFKVDAIPYGASALHWSDCSVNNAPALPPGPCDCGGYDPRGRGV